jgi:YD repeat-containing protein
MPATASFVYDRNGNLTSDGRRGFGYDDFDQLTSVTVTNAWRSEFKYDALGRRRVRVEKVWKNSQWVTASETLYVYDTCSRSWKRDALNLPTATYTRDSTSAGACSGPAASAVLLALTLHSSLSTPHFFYHADAGGNVTALTRRPPDRRSPGTGRSGGNLLGLSGPMAEVNLYRFLEQEFSTPTPVCTTTATGSTSRASMRWPKQRSVGRSRGIDLYQFVYSNPVNYVDPSGLAGTPLEFISIPKQ